MDNSVKDIKVDSYVKRINVEETEFIKIINVSVQRELMKIINRIYVHNVIFILLKT